MAASDDITARALTLAHLAEVLRAARRPRPAPPTALRTAIALHEEKGNVVNAEQCRELLAAVER